MVEAKGGCRNNGSELLFFFLILVFIFMSCDFF